MVQKQKKKDKYRFAWYYFESHENT